MTSRDDSYRAARDSFDRLPLDQKLEFLLDAGLSTLVRGVETTGAALANEAEQALRAAAEAARDAGRSARRAARDVADMAEEMGDSVRATAQKAAEDVAEAASPPRTREPHTPSAPTGSATPPPMPDPSVTHHDTPDRRSTPDSSQGAAEASSMPGDETDSESDEASPLA